MIQKEEIERIFDRAKYEALALVCAESETEPEAQVFAQPEWLTKEELAKHWRLDSVAGIESWMKREKFPLPYGCLGTLIRFQRLEVDQWAKDEAKRQKLKRERKDGDGANHGLRLTQGGSN